jgi:hypothetical protein
VKIELSRDWTEFLSVLIDRRVRFVLVGGHAVAGHGEPRLTEDLDVFVEPTAVNARRLRRALDDFGFGAVAPDVEELAVPDKIFMLGRKPWRIDILTGIDGVTFREAWTTKVEADFAVRPLYLIGREALIANKRASARDKDLLDTPGRNRDQVLGLRRLQRNQGARRRHVRRHRGGPLGARRPSPSPTRASTHATRG